MRLIWSLNAWEDYLWCQAHEPKLVAKINELIKDARRSPFSGLGKPEPLKGDLTGFWSRRITGDHRFVYRVTGTGSAQALEIVQCRYHY